MCFGFGFELIYELHTVRFVYVSACFNMYVCIYLVWHPIRGPYPQDTTSERAPKTRAAWHHRILLPMHRPDCVGRSPEYIIY